MSCTSDPDPRSTAADLQGDERGFSRGDFLRRTAALGTALTLPGLGESVAASAAAPAAATPRRGGTMRAAWIGGGTSQSLDPNNPSADVEGGRVDLIYDRLVLLNEDYSVRYSLATLFEPYRNRANDWIIHLRRGVTWHDGSPFTADDVIYTFKRINNPKSGVQGRNVTSMIDFARLKKLDPWTLRVPLKLFNSEFPSFFWDPNWQIIKNGTTDFTKPNGTGPFKFVSWIPGQHTQLKRNPDYWQHGTPYFDEFVILEIPDQTARLNALLGGQIDWMESPTYAQVKAQRAGGSSNARFIPGPSTNIIPIYMAVTLPPFRDVRVRQAMRLIADRPALVEAAQLGFGEVANDLYGKGIRFYDSALPQRVQDIDKAKALLKAAGQSDLRVTLNSGNYWAGGLESATVFAQQAKKAGVTINVRNIAADQYFGQNYLKQNFAQSLWFGEPLITHYAKNQVKNANYPEPHWNDPRTQRLYNEILAELKPNKKRELFGEFQKIFWNEGGYLIWGNFPRFSAVSKKFHGGVQLPSGTDFTHAWLG